MTVGGLTAEGLSKRVFLRASEGHGSPGGAVKCVEIRRNTKGEGSVLGGT